VVVVKFAAGEPLTFFNLWKNALREGGNQYAHQVLGADSTRVSLYTVSNLSKLSMRVADGLRQSIKIEPGMRVAILADGYGDLLPVYHALWLLGCTVVAIPGDQPSDITVGQMNNTGCQVLVYSPAMSARLASVAPAVTCIKHWVLVGGAKTTALGSGRSVLKLDDLVLNSNRGLKMDDFQPKASKQEHPALITFTSGAAIEPRGVAFNAETIIEAARCQTCLYYLDSEGERVACLLPDKSFVSLLHMVVLPLVAGYTSVALPDLEASKRGSNILEELYDNQVSAVWLNESHLPDLRKATKSQRFVMSEKFRAFLLPTRPVSKQEVEGMPEVIVPCYGQTEAGGIIAVGSKANLYTCALASRDRTPLLSAGGPIANVQVRVVDPTGEPTRGSDIGEIVVNAKQIMESYDGSHPGASYLGPDGFLHTGDRGYWSFDSDGKPHLVIVGREEQFVSRGKHEVSLFQLEMVISKVMGVTGVRVVGFPHAKYGKEIGAFVLLAKRAQVTRESLWANLIKYFPWEVVPKVFMLADTSAVSVIPPRREIEEALACFGSTDFSTPLKL